jgi:hypothetical protein
MTYEASVCALSRKWVKLFQIRTFYIGGSLEFEATRTEEIRFRK